MPLAVRELLPAGSVTLAALHDVGKISSGFLRKCPAWLVEKNLAESALREFWQGAESDHSVVSQYCLQNRLQKDNAELWAVAVGAHHGRIHGRRINHLKETAARAASEREARQELVEKFIQLFGDLPAREPKPDLSDLWLLAGLIAVADWIGSNEEFFSPACGLSVTDATSRAEASLACINWSGGQLLAGRDFAGTFGIANGPNALQKALLESVAGVGCYIVEGPMGCGKTEAALAAAQKLIVGGHNEGIYFALPTQVTSNRIHRRVGQFLGHALAQRTNFRLAHAASWLDENQVIQIRPAALHDKESDSQAAEARSWFASSRHGLLARYGVGTIDQALQAVVAVKHFFVRRFGLAGKVVILDEVHSYDVYTGALIKQLVRELLALRCTVIVLSATLTRARTQELLDCVPGQDKNAATPGPGTERAYPLITFATKQRGVGQLALAWEHEKRVRFRVEALAENEIIEECLKRAEAGQHVLYLRNTVAEAQDSYRAFASAMRSGSARLGLLHSRFPFFRREELEEDWLQRLGKERAEEDSGSILVATQVVEQSVDIDLDFIVSDTAPTDMLLQRMGRLWRHPRAHRKALEPEFWVNVPVVDEHSSARQLKAAFGKTARVYAPYVLLRTMQVLTGRKFVVLPTQIRELLEATYTDVDTDAERPGWRELRQELERVREELAAEAEAATLVLGRPSQADREEVLTRRSGVPTRPVVLLKACQMSDAGTWRLVGLNGTVTEASHRDWRYSVARTLHRNLVSIPRYMVNRQVLPDWLALHVPGLPAWAVVQEDGRCEFPESDESSVLGYNSALGVYADSTRLQTRKWEEDDEFDY
jgi:CRISPR-associated endonuclease/helicase Cas3